MTELKLEKCHVREWRTEDVESLVRNANNRNVSRNLMERFPYPYTAADAEGWIRRATSENPMTHFAIEVDGSAVGGIGFHLRTDVHHRSAEIGYWLAEPYWGRGIATEALRAVTEHAFANHDLVRLQAHVFEWNAASARVLEKSGYTREARLRKSVTKEGRTVDSFLYALVRE
jgi:ribosomal-protein-alanine N-acetyltransferase